MALLICEGACNPTLWRFDSAALFYGQHISENVRGRPDATGLLDAITEERKRLRHTLHSHRYGNRWVCLTCGTERAYGASAWPVELYA
jgi:hypothetical protein